MSNDIERARAKRVAAKLTSEVGPIVFERMSMMTDDLCSVSPDIIAEGMRERPDLQIAFRKLASYYGQIVAKLDEQKG